MKARFLLWFTLVGLVALPAAAQTSSSKPNILFILADDLGWADLEPYGSLYHRTPNLARLAGRSVRLTQYHAASPLCSPTRSSILTGLYPARTGITAPVCHLPQVQLEKRLSPGNPNQRVLVADSLTRLKTDHKTLANVFHDAGYATAHFGKWHLGDEAEYQPNKRGFDEVFIHGTGGIGQAFANCSSGDAPGNDSSASESSASESTPSTSTAY